MLCFSQRLCESNAVRAVALLGPTAQEPIVRRFELPGVNLCSGNELDPTDRPDAALIFGGDGTIHRHLGGLALKQIPTLIVPLGSANDFAHSIGVETVQKALAAWTGFCAGENNVRAIDLGTIEPLDETKRMEPIAWQEESLESLHFVPDGPRPELAQMGPRIMQSQLRRRNEAAREASRTTFYGSIAGTGLDAAVNRVTLKQPRWLRAHGGYVVALVQVLRRFRPPRVTLAVEVDGCWQTRLDEPGISDRSGKRSAVRPRHEADAPGKNGRWSTRHLFCATAQQIAVVTSI